MFKTTPDGTSIAITLLLSTTLLLTASSGVRAATYVIQSDQSRVRFEIGHYEYAKPVRGRFTSISGQIELQTIEARATDALAAVEALSVDVVIDAASVDTDNRYRDSHLRSAFFEVDEFPRIRFTVAERAFTPTELREGEERTIEGWLTMKDITRPVTLVVEGGREFTDAEGRSIVRCRMHGRINRRDFDVEENAEQATGLSQILAHIQEGLDEFIDDDVEIAITVVARER